MGKPRYENYPRDTDLDYGDPTEYFGIDSLFTNYRVDRRLYWVKPESVRGRLLVGDQQMDLTADTTYRAIRFEHIDDRGAPTGAYVFLLYRELFPFSTMFTDHVPIEQIEPDWPEGVEFPDHSLVERITHPGAKTLLIDTEQLWRERGGDPLYKFPKTGGRKLKDT